MRTNVFRCIAGLMLIALTCGLSIETVLAERQDRINSLGTIDEVSPEAGRVSIDGRTYQLDVERTRVWRGNERVDPTTLEAGMHVAFALSKEPRKGDGPPAIASIVIPGTQGHRQGLH